MEPVVPQGDKKKANLRMALILLSVVILFFVGFIARMAFFGH